MARGVNKPIEVGRRLVVCSAGQCDPADELIPLYLGRARAFGSGLHETTFSCLEEMEAMGPMNGLRVLDVGCGTGILSVAALLLGADRAVAFDIDPEGARACASNARLNGVHPQTSVYCGTLHALGPRASFHLILANIYGDIIIDLAAELAGRLKEDGAMILSGIALDHMSDVRREFEKLGLVQVKNRIMEEYVTMIWEKTVPRSL